MQVIQRLLESLLWLMVSNYKKKIRSIYQNIYELKNSENKKNIIVVFGLVL